MSCEEELMKYRLFLDEFSAKNKSDEDYDFSAVKVYSYRLNESEIDAEIISCCLQYLYENKCPIKLQGPIIQFVLKNFHDALKLKVNLHLYGYDENDKAFEPLKIKAYALNNVKLYCQQLLDNVEFNKILPKLQDPDSTPLFAVSSIKNKRRYMEDRYCIINNFNTIYNVKSSIDETNFYGVFDGHDGIHAAYYSSSQLPYSLAKNPLYLTNPIEAIRQAFLSIDTTFVEKAYTQSVKGGTTAVCALHRPHEKHLYVAWVGDSRALLVKQGKIMQIVESHKPENLREKKRIHAAGGCLINWCGVLRVDGLLNITRSIGDSRCKPHVCAEPDIVALELDNDEDFLILACDGLWDHVREEDIASIVYEQLKEDSEDLQKITKKLVDKAKQEGSSDNTTIVIAFLKHPSQIAKSSWKLEVIEQKFEHNEQILNSIEEEEIVDEEKVLRNQYENGNHDQNLDLVDCLNINSLPNDNFATARNNEMQRSDAELEEKFQEHFSSGKNFDDNEIQAPTETDDNPIESIESELGEESEEDEWNYIQLKEGEGEKKIIQNEMVVSTKLVNDTDQKEIDVQYDIKDDSELPNALEDEHNLLTSNVNKFETEISYDERVYLNNNGTVESENLVNSAVKDFSPKLKLKLNDEIIAQSPRKGASSNMENILVPNEIEFEYEADGRPHDTELKENLVIDIENIQVPDEQKFDAEADVRPHEIADLIETTSSENKINTSHQLINLLSGNGSVLNSSENKEKIQNNISLDQTEKCNENKVNDDKGLKENLEDSETALLPKKDVEDVTNLISGIRDIKINVIKKSAVDQKTLQKNSKVHQPVSSRNTNTHKIKTLKTFTRAPKVSDIKPTVTTKNSVEKKLTTITKPRIDLKTTANLPTRKPISIRTANPKMPSANIPPTIKTSTIQNTLKSRPNSVQSNSNATTKTNLSTERPNKLPSATTKRIIPRETLTSALRKIEAVRVPTSRISAKSSTTTIRLAPPTITRKTTSETTVTTKVTSIGKDRKLGSAVTTKQPIAKEKTTEKTKSLDVAK